MSIPPTLLLADDSLTIQRVVSLTFADQPVRVVVAKDGQDAINRMSKERPDVVLADTNMPCVDGYELARWVRQQPHLTSVPVLLLAGASDPVDEQRLHDSGANGVLEKPFEPSHVISRVKELLGIKAPPPPTRLVTAPDLSPAPAPARKSSPSRPAAGAAAERPEPAVPPAPPAQEPRPAWPTERATALGADTSSADSAVPFGAEVTDAGGDMDELGGVRGDARDWFGGDSAAPDSGASPLAQELGVSDLRFYGQGDDVPASRGIDADFSSEREGRQPMPSRTGRETGGDASTADVFQSLLAAEQGDPARPIVVREGGPELTPEMLDQLAARVVERLRPNVLRDELQRGLEMGLREAVAHTVRDSVVAETRAAVAEAVQAAVNGPILGSVRGAVNEAVSAAVPAAIEQQVGAKVEMAIAREFRDTVAGLVQQTVRDVVETAVRAAVADAVAAAVPAAVLDVVRGDADGHVRQIVHETADRLIREEIARIRERRA